MPVKLSVLRPGAGGRDRLRYAQRRPVLGAVDQIADRVLQILIADRFFLADQDHRSRWNIAAPVDGPLESIEHVVAMDH